MRWLFRIAFALLAPLAVACDGEDAGGGGAGTDGDTDGDTDADAGPDGGDEACGVLESPCCEVAPACWGGYVAADLDGEGGQGCFCFLPANIVLCDGEEYPQFEGLEVGCADVSSGAGIGACFADQDMEPLECEAESTCVTASDDPNGICLSESTNDYCLSACTPEPECPAGYSWVAVEEDAQVCAICISDEFLTVD